MRVAVHYDEQRVQYLGVLLQQSSEVSRRFGIELVDCGDRPVDVFSCDAVIAHGKYISHQCIDSGKPVILAERRDSSILFNRQFVDAPNLVAIWKIAVGAWPAQTSGHERWHVHLLSPVQGPTLPYLSDRARDLLQPVHGYGAYPRFERWLPCLYSDAEPARRHLIHFRGKTDYKGVQTISDHRRKAVRMTRLAGGRSGVRVDRGVYEREMRESKMCLSPWGFGELCWRDYEATCAGSLLIKPESDYVETWPRLFEAGVTYMACKPDLSDLCEVVQQALSQPALVRQMICESRERLRQALEPSRLLDPFVPGLERLAAWSR